MNPYRLTLPALAATCLDPPRACETRAGATSTTGPTRRIEYLLAVSISIALVTGAVALHAVGHGGRVEIAPNAVALARAHHAQKAKLTKPRSFPAKHEESRLAPEHAWLGGTHDPRVLLARAREQASIGLDVAVMDVSLAHAPERGTPTTNDFPTRSLPVRNGVSHVDALEIRGLPDASPLHVAGLANGDELLGVNGYRFDDDSFHDIDIGAISKRGAMIVELARNGHHVVLFVHWNASHRGKEV